VDVKRRAAVSASGDFIKLSTNSLEF
jgi:hypothetical protein